MFSIKETNYVFKNWSESVRCEPEQYVEPNNLSELQAIVRQAFVDRKTIRVVGAGHSFTPLVATSDIMVSLKHLAGIDHIDRENNLVTVWGGSLLKDLGTQLWEHGFAMENLGDINKQSIAGAISTGTHGTGIQFGSISTQAVGITLLLASGELLEVDETNEAGVFQAAQVSLGMLGIIVKVTLKVLPAYQLTGTSYKLSLDETFQQLDTLCEQHRNIEFYWFPYTDTVQVKTFDLAAPNKEKDQKQMKFKKVVVENGLFWLMSEVSRLVPQSAKSISTLSAIGVPVGTETNDSYEIYATPRLVKFQEMEYSVPKKYLPTILRTIDEVVREKKYAVHFPLECRFVKADNIWLSPSYERESAYIAVHMYKGMEFSSYFQALGEIFQAYDGRPHWGKMHTMTKADLQTAYPKMEDFISLRKRLDERGIFLNEYVCELFQLKN